jgi:hypothetical protein
LDKVCVKGKGQLQTYWIYPCKNPKSAVTKSVTTASTSSEHGKEKVNIHGVDLLHAERAECNQHLVDWNVEMLYGLLVKLVSSRGATNAPVNHTLLEQNMPSSASHLVIDEMTQILCIPAFNEKKCSRRCYLPMKLSHASKGDS